MVARHAVAAWHATRTRGWWLLAAVLPAHGADLGGAAGLASDKIVRGISQTGGQPVALLDLNLVLAEGWSATLSAATLHDRGAAEIVLGAGWSRQLDGVWFAQAGLSTYQYTRGSFRNAPYAEAHASLTWDGRASLLLTASPDSEYPGLQGGDERPRQTRSIELGWHQRLHGRWALDLGVGRFAIAGLPAYVYGSVGLGWGTGPWQLMASRIGSNAVGRGLLPAGYGGPAWACSVIRSF